MSLQTHLLLPTPGAAALQQAGCAGSEQGQLASGQGQQASTQVCGSAGVNWRATYEDLAKLSDGRHFTGFEGVPLNKLLELNMGQAVSWAGAAAMLGAGTAGKRQSQAGCPMSPPSASAPVRRRRHQDVCIAGQGWSACPLTSAPLPDALHPPDTLHPPDALHPRLLLAGVAAGPGGAGGAQRQGRGWLPVRGQAV